MKKSIIKTIFTLLFLCGITHATSFEVTQVIEVDSAVGGPMLGPIKWSPDGTKLSYFKGKQLYISDTLGNSTFVEELEFFPHRYEWIDNNKLMVHIKKQEGPTSINKLITVDINTHQDSLVDSYIYQTGKSSKIAGFKSFRGPFLTLEGKAYYEIITMADVKNNPKTIDRIGIAAGDPNTIPLNSISTNHILNWQDSNLYLNKIDGSDSTLLRSGFGTQDLFVKVSDDHNFLSISYNLINLETLQNIMLLDYIQEKPANTYYCDIMYNSFNPVKNELLFQIVCEGDDPYSTTDVGIFDYSTNEFYILDTIINLHNSHSPIFCADGKKIALISEAKLYIVYRANNNEN